MVDMFPQRIVPFELVNQTERPFVVPERGSGERVGLKHSRVSYAGISEMLRAEFLCVFSRLASGEPFC